jgi:hypothetical protein
MDREALKFAQFGLCHILQEIQGELDARTINIREMIPGILDFFNTIYLFHYSILSTIIS